MSVSGIDDEDVCGVTSLSGVDEGTDVLHIVKVICALVISCVRTMLQPLNG